ncbi:MAG: hypothetical protein IIB94_00170 [Candidatus Marinimicrobia bacterium]|nr:hypothetical protein [Candidatus Neomarinimicrobiota bacterium]
MPESEEVKSGADKIEIPKVKKGISSKFIILGVFGYLSVLGLMIVGMVYFLKPDVTSVAIVQPAVNTATVQNNSTNKKDLIDPDIKEAVEGYLDDPESIDISDLVNELKEIEYKRNLRYKMEQDSIARLQAERETKITRAKLEELKIQTAKLIAARPKPIAAEKEKAETKSEKSGATQTTLIDNAKSKRGLKQLAKIYSSMKPTDAAKILDKMDTKLVVNLLATMKDRNAAKILSSFKPEKAARISKKINDKFAQI